MSIYITPKIWGPICWNFLYSIASKYDPIYRDEYFYLLKKLEYILPCPNCIIHLKEYIRKTGISQKKMSKKYLINWLSNLHENISNKKQLYSKTLEIINKDNYINNKNIIIFFIIINSYYLTQNISTHHFCQIKTFYELMKYIYPINKTRNKFLHIVNSVEFKKIHDSESLNNFFKIKFENII